MHGIFPFRFRKQYSFTQRLFLRKEVYDIFQWYYANIDFFRWVKVLFLANFRGTAVKLASKISPLSSQVKKKIPLIKSLSNREICNDFRLLKFSTFIFCIAVLVFKLLFFVQKYLLVNGSGFVKLFPFTRECSRLRCLWLPRTGTERGSVQTMSLFINICFRYWLGKKAEPLLRVCGIQPLARDWALTGNTRVNL